MNTRDITHNDAKHIEFLVIGSAHLDVIATADANQNLTDKQGQVSIEIGGSAGNIALNLKQLGASVSLLTASNQSTYSTLVMNLLQRKGVDVFVEKNDDLPLSAFSAHLDAKGEMIGAVTCAGVELHKFSDEVLEGALANANCVIVDCNLSQSELLRITSLCSERFIPVYATGVSEQKALRLAEIAPILEAAFINRREALYIAEHAFGEKNQVDLAKLAEKMATTLVVTDGVKEAIVARAVPRKVTRINPQTQKDVQNVLGMSDAFIASTVFALMSFEMGIEDSAYTMLPYLSGIASRTGCNLAESGMLDSMMGELKKNAQICPTTQILNRGASEEKLKKLIYSVQNECSTVSIALIDVDHFKAINDSLGHNTGDQILAMVAAGIRKVLRGHDEVGRWGGDEFIALIQGDEASAVKVAERIMASVKQQCAHVSAVTLSIGVAEWSNAMQTSVDLVHAADQALYEVKRNGRNGVQKASNVEK